MSSLKLSYEVVCLFRSFSKCCVLEVVEKCTKGSSRAHGAQNTKKFYSQIWGQKFVRFWYELEALREVRLAFLWKRILIARSYQVLEVDIKSLIYSGNEAQIPNFGNSFTIFGIFMLFVRKQAFTLGQWFFTKN